MFALAPGGSAVAASPEDSPDNPVQDPEIIFFGEKRFVDNGDGTVTDLKTGLMWLQDANFPKQSLPIQVAKKYLVKLNRGEYENRGYTDWRLPSVKEFQALVDKSRSSPALSVGHPFLHVQNGYYWSSSGGINIVEYVWLMDIAYGIVKFDYPSYCNFQYLWPVRDAR